MRGARTVTVPPSLWRHPTKCAVQATPSSSVSDSSSRARPATGACRRRRCRQHGGQQQEVTRKPQPRTNAPGQPRTRLR
eukprot:3361676-Lingulodinium_polyedra.AAC.1